MSNKNKKKYYYEDLKSRLCLITGSAGALGASIADTLLKLGAKLILTDHPNADKKKIQQIIKKWGPKRVSFIPCDLESEKQRDILIKKILKEKPGLSCLINNAAFVGDSCLSGWSTDFRKQQLDTWRRALEVNLTAPFHLIRDLTDSLKKGNGSNIINITSIYADSAPDWKIYRGTKLGNPAAYAVSKAGLSQLTRWLATTLAPHIRVNAIAPGGIQRNQPKKFIKKYEAKTPLQRMANEDDFAGAIAFLATDRSKYVTGQIFKIDGGWSVW